MSLNFSNVREKKKTAFSCEPCRQRKVKCPGQQPRCSKCIARKDNCEYKLSPTLSYTQRLEARVQELESLFSRYGTVSQGSSSTVASTVHAPAKNVLGPPDPVEPLVSNSFEGLRLDAKGSITYSSSTSFFQPLVEVGSDEDDDDRSISSRRRPTFSSPEEDSRRRARLKQNAWYQKSLEILADTPEPFQYMLNDHWCWIQPLFNFIYRPAFTRDLQTLGNYYSHTLLNAVLAHNARWCRSEPRLWSLLEPYDGGALFSRHARTLLFDEISQGRCNIPTVQTLLLLSAQECGAGNRTQAWVYSGIAFRLIEDMGICVDNQKYATEGQLSDEDIEIRNRLFWSCYFWDKMISLYLGRTPVLQHSTISPPQDIFDDSAEEDIWTPHGLVYPPGSEYPPMQARSTSCFNQMCRLSVILNQILLHFYDSRQEKSKAQLKAALDQQGAALRSWWEQLPEYLRIDATNLPSHAPPSHIVTLNCLFHTFKILLYRPMLFRRNTVRGDFTPETEHFKECLTSASSIVAIFDLFRRSFGEARVILSLAYSIYTASSIFLLRLQADSSQDWFSRRRMAFCVSVLDRVKTNTPVINDALNLISRSLSKAGIDNHSALSTPKAPVLVVKDEENFSQPFNTPTSSTGSPLFTNHPEFDTSSISPLGDFNLSDIQVDADMLDGFLNLEPISVNVGALDPFL